MSVFGSYIARLFTLMLGVLLVVGTFLTTLNAATFDKNHVIDDSHFIDTEYSINWIQNQLEAIGGSSSLLANWVDEVDIYVWSNRFETPNKRCLVHKATGWSAAKIIHEASTDWQADYVKWFNGTTEVSKDPNKYTGSVTSCDTVVEYPPAPGGLKTVSPKVILATMQKEQSIVTATGTYSKNISGYINCNSSATCDVNSNEYKLSWAMGYGYAESGTPRYNYKGLYNQINFGAWQLRANYERSGSFTSWDGLVVDNGSPCPHEFKVDQTCFIDSTTVRPENRATAALYRYTPHIAGSQSFVAHYENWFGNAVGKPYKFIGGITGSGQIFQGESRNAQIIIQNNSLSTWYSDDALPPGENPTRLATVGFVPTPYADLSDSAWMGGGTQIKMVESSVPPGENATFNFIFTAPSQIINNYVTRFQPIVSGHREYPFYGMQFVTSTPDSYFNAAIHQVQTPPPDTLISGATWRTTVLLKNTGTLTWYSDQSSQNGGNPVRLVTAGYKQTPYAAPGYDPAWMGTSHTIKMVEQEVGPGAVGSFNFVFYSPYRQTSFVHSFDLIVNGREIIEKNVVSLSLNTPQPDFSYTFSFEDSIGPGTTMPSGQIKSVRIGLINTGNVVWRNLSRQVGSAGTMRLIMANPNYRTSNFYDSANSVWLSPRAVDLSTPYVAPGEAGLFDFTWKAPISAPGFYGEAFLPGILGVVYFTDLGMAFNTTVQ